MKKQSKTQKGNYYKRKTKQFFIRQGYDTEYLEIYTNIFIPGRGQFLKKRDLFACDGMSMNRDEIIFWNSKSRVKDIKFDMKKFEQYKFPPFVTLAIVVWEYRARQPTILFKRDNTLRWFNKPNNAQDDYLDVK